MTGKTFRKLALGHEGAAEGRHMGHADFRVNGRIFATLTADERKGMVKLTPDQQKFLLREHAEFFEPANGAWGRQGCTMVLLDAADAETVGPAMTHAWQNEVNRPAGRRAPGTRRTR